MTELGNRAQNYAQKKGLNFRPKKEGALKFKKLFRGGLN